MSHGRQHFLTYFKTIYGNWGKFILTLHLEWAHCFINPQAPNFWLILIYTRSPEFWCFFMCLFFLKFTRTFVFNAAQLYPSGLVWPAYLHLLTQSNRPAYGPHKPPWLWFSFVPHNSFLSFSVFEIILHNILTRPLIEKRWCFIFPKRLRRCSVLNHMHPP